MDQDTLISCLIHFSYVRTGVNAELLERSSPVRTFDIDVRTFDIDVRTFNIDVRTFDIDVRTFNISRDGSVSTVSLHIC